MRVRDDAVVETFLDAGLLGAGSKVLPRAGPIEGKTARPPRSLSVPPHALVASSTVSLIVFGSMTVPSNFVASSRYIEA